MGRTVSGGMHVDRVRSRHTTKSGKTREYVSHLLRRSFRKPDGRVGKETLANLSVLPVAAVDAIEAVLAGKTLVEADAAFELVRARPHGHVALVHSQAKALGLPALLGPPCRERDLAFALILSRVVRPKTKLATKAWWDDVTLGTDLDITGASRDQVYAAMDWLLARQDHIEGRLAARHLSEGAIVMFDLSSSWVEGTHCELAARGYSRDGKKGKEQIEYGLLTDAAGRPVAIRVFGGSTADPTAFIEAVDVVTKKFGLTELTLVGDRGMITSARVDAIRAIDGLSWITCLRNPAISALAADDGPLQMSLFDTQDLAEITHPDYPGERLIACRNPALAQHRALKREQLLAATETVLAPITARAGARGLRTAAAIGVALGKVINKYKMAKHFTWVITDTSLTYERNQDSITTEAALDGIYVIRTSVPATALDTAATVTAYKNLAHVERNFRNIKADDLDLRPIHHYRTDRVRAHVLICMLAQYLNWHLRKTLAPLTYTDTEPPHRDNPVAPARRSNTAANKATRHADENNNLIRSYRGLLEHMGTLTRNTVKINGQTFEKLTTPTPTQQRAFELLHTPIPLTLTSK